MATQAPKPPRRSAPADQRPIEPVSGLPGSDDAPMPLQAVLCTQELYRRPSRAPDHETEIRAFTKLVTALADSPETILQTLADTILELFHCDSAGVSLLTTDDGGKRFHWPAVSGVWKPHVGGGTPREFSPCGDVLDCNAPLLFRRLERHYTYFAPVTPPAEEALLIPFSVNGRAVGTIWALAHDARRRFDAEDLRQLQSLGRFASAGYQAMRLGQKTHDSRRAALNLMEDAVLAREAAERLNAELRVSEERLRTLADNMAQFAWTADAKGWIYWYNQRWYDYTGTTLQEMKGGGWKAVQHPDHVDRVMAQLQHSWDTGEVWEDTFPLRGKDGRYRWFLTCAVPIRDAAGTVQRWFGTNTDITVQREMAEELRESAALLAAGDRHKNEFLATLAHELRNPLAPIRNALQIMRRNGGDAAAVAAASQMMERQVAQMVRLVDDLLDVSRISRGRIELRRLRIDLVSLVQEAVEAARPGCASKGVELTLDVPATPLLIAADATRLAQVAGNLLNNACKFTERGGSITLTLQHEGDEAVIKVSDSGIGIAAEQLPRIFEMFTQIDNSFERSGGLGIGLTLVKTLVELHGGSVLAKSGGVGRGSEFEVRLPIPPTTAEAGAAAAPPPAGAAAPAATVARRILVVDDNRDAAESLAALLQMGGHATRLAYDGLDAVAAAEQFRPDLVLLDLGLPKLNGYDAARRMRQAAWGQTIVLVALTGWGHQDDRDKSTLAGFDQHLVKPVDPDALMALVADLPAR